MNFFLLRTNMQDRMGARRPAVELARVLTSHYFRLRPFLSVLELYPKIIKLIREEKDRKEYSSWIGEDNEAISHEEFVKRLRPLSVVDGRSPSLLSSKLTGRKNDNIKHLVDWMFSAVKHGEVYTKSDVLDMNEKSVTTRDCAPPASQR